MQIVIDIPEEIIKDAKESPNYYPSYLFGTIWKSIGNGTPIPDNATNGDAIKAMFPNERIYKCQFGYDFEECSFDEEWWNAPYQKDGKE